MNMPYIVSIQVGRPTVCGDKTASDQMDRPWMTGFFKEPVEGIVWLSKSNLSGDGQADLKNHGGPEKAILAYSADHYPAWQLEMSRRNLPYGSFGENFTIAGLTEETVCIGDTYSVEDVRLQVSQPRQPCWKISRRWGIRDLAERVQSTGRTGWYFRVLTEGFVERGLQIILRDRPYPQWTVARANEMMHHRHNNRHAAAELASCLLLSSNWRSTLSARRHQEIIKKGFKRFIYGLKRLSYPKDDSSREKKDV